MPLYADILDELRALQNQMLSEREKCAREFPMIDARLGEVRAEMHSLEVSFRTVQVGITDICERMNNVEKANKEGKRQRFLADSLHRLDVDERLTPSASVLEHPTDGMRYGVETVEVELNIAFVGDVQVNRDEAELTK